MPLTSLADIQSRLANYASRLDKLQTPSEVLNGLHDVTKKSVQLSVLGAARFPQKSGDWSSIHLGQSAFLHSEVPKGWWGEYANLGLGSFCPILYLAQRGMASYTWTEARLICDPVGADRRADDLAVKHGMRDGLSCPVGGRWVVVFWSGKELSKILRPPTRNMIFAAASFAALRLDQLTDPVLVNQGGSPVRLSPRAIAVLRLVSTGAQSREIARALGIGEETVRSHIKKAQRKLGARNRAQVVAMALRENLIF